MNGCRSPQPPVRAHVALFGDRLPPAPTDPKTSQLAACVSVMSVRISENRGELG